MILIGQYDSSFVRRVGIALRLYGIPFEHRPWSVFSDADKVRELNPLCRVPTFVTDDGLALGGTDAILDYVDSLAPADRRLYPQTQPQRVRAMRIAHLASGIADKTVSLFYEKVLHEAPAPAFMARLEGQIRDAAAALERERSGSAAPFWGGDRIGHADIATACSVRHCRDSLPGMIDAAAHPALSQLCSRLEDMPVFREISQPFIPPA